ncbi:hypothetical protein VTJ04DRAFT_9059 [Mycothermus thermophilus]|uniref:uncharacterized protein n=1 Tax=Humicola insolens TaxID=85995 RepID=UPI003742A9B7
MCAFDGSGFFLPRPTLASPALCNGQASPSFPGFSLSRQHVIVAELPLGPMSHSGAASGRQLLKPRVVRTHPGLGLHPAALKQHRAPKSEPASKSTSVPDIGAPSVFPVRAGVNDRHVYLSHS